MEIKDWYQCFLSFLVLWISVASKKIKKNK
ncbi:hypothetical protein DIKCMJMK_04195 [Shewanella oneidensis]|nr:hypothetical protein [Shewanella oneidensis]